VASNEENDLSDSPPSLAPVEAAGPLLQPGFDLDPTNDDANERTNERTNKRTNEEKLRKNVFFRLL